jgi:hypothetical protein
MKQIFYSQDTKIEITDHEFEEMTSCHRENKPYVCVRLKMSIPAIGYKFAGNKLGMAGYKEFMAVKKGMEGMETFYSPELEELFLKHFYYEIVGEDGENIRLQEITLQQLLNMGIEFLIEKDSFYEYEFNFFPSNQLFEKINGTKIKKYFINKNKKEDEKVEKK